MLIFRSQSRTIATDTWSTTTAPHITALNLPLPSAALAMDGTQEAQTALALSVGLSRAFLLSRGGEVL